MNNNAVYRLENGLLHQENAADTKPLVIILAGPTASGKTATAIAVAKAIDGEIISADSMQIYRGMDIGTAKATEQEQQMVPHHLLDIKDPAEPFSVAAWLESAIATINQILTRGHVPIVCGGTGQYISALMDGLRFVPSPSDPALRSRLIERAERDGNETLLQELRRLDPETADRLHVNDRKRIVRALEVYQLTGHTQSEINRQSKETESPYRFLGFCIWPDRAVLYDRINQRVDFMMQNGLLDEVRRLDPGNLPLTATGRQAIGYKELASYLSGLITLDEAVDRIKQSSRQYAKRQMTWFRRMTALEKLDGQDPADLSRIIIDAYHRAIE